MIQDKKPKVSIVIIFLNGEKFIQETIESVLAQTYTNWEILLVDDGSSDNSTPIAQKYTNQFPEKIYYLDHPDHQNLGKCPSRNLGSKRASGKYIIFLDADDVLLPHKLERQVAIFEFNPEIGMVYGPSLYWHGWTGKKEDLIRDHMDKVGVIPERVYQPPELMTVFLSGGSNVPCPCGIMVRKNILDANGGWEDDHRDIFKNLFNFEDQVFQAKIMLNYPVYVEGVSGDKYRQHSGMTTIQSTNKDRLNAQLIYLQWLTRYIVQNGLKDPDLNAALRVMKKTLFINQIKTRVRNILPRIILRMWRILKEVSGIVPAKGRVRLGDLHQTAPLSRNFGIDRGGAIDGKYIQNFLIKHRADIKGSVLEIGDNVYTRKFGGDQVHRSEILDIDTKNTKVTILADLAEAQQVPSNSFDCVILTQVLQLIFDYRAAIQTVHRVLKPGGVLLMTVPGITQIPHQEFGKTWYWSFTEASVKRILEDIFASPDVTVKIHGNVLVATGFLYGLGVSELKKEEYEYTDPDYQVIITARAVKER